MRMLPGGPAVALTREPAGAMPEAHGVDEGVAGVGGGEGDFAADGGDAEAVAVAADAGDDAFEEALVAGLVEGAEAEGVEEGDGAGAHGDDVADDAADAGGCALVGLDGAGVGCGIRFS